jgi:hypothetical protein
MAGKSAAKSGDVKPKPGTTFYSPAVKGSWKKVGDVQETSYSSLKSGGAAVLHKVECKFSFSGTGPTPAEAPVTTVETVTLVGMTTLLQKGLSNVIVDGDVKTDSWGNELKATASGPLKTA